jgi:hypothetical protein
MGPASAEWVSAGAVVGFLYTSVAILCRGAQVRQGGGRSMAGFTCAVCVAAAPAGCPRAPPARPARPPALRPPPPAPARPGRRCAARPLGRRPPVAAQPAGGAVRGQHPRVWIQLLRKHDLHFFRGAHAREAGELWCRLLPLPASRPYKAFPGCLPPSPEPPVHLPLPPLQPPCPLPSWTTTPTASWCCCRRAPRSTPRCTASRRGPTPAS